MFFYYTLTYDCPIKNTSINVNKKCILFILIWRDNLVCPNVLSVQRYYQLKTVKLMHTLCSFFSDSIQQRQ